MTEKQFSEIQASIQDLNATLLAGFGTLAGLEHANSRAAYLGRELTTAELMTAVHEGLDTVMMVKDNAVQILSGSVEGS